MGHPKTGVSEMAAGKQDKLNYRSSKKWRLSEMAGQQDKLTYGPSKKWTLSEKAGKQDKLD